MLQRCVNPDRPTTFRDAYLIHPQGSTATELLNCCGNFCPRNYMASFPAPLVWFLHEVRVGGTKEALKVSLPPSDNILSCEQCEEVTFFLPPWGAKISSEPIESDLPRSHRILPHPSFCLGECYKMLGPPAAVSSMQSPPGQVCPPLTLTSGRASGRRSGLILK